MKNILAISALLVLVAGAATAATSQTGERPDQNPMPSTDAQVVEVRASTIYSNNKELARAGLMPNDIVKVTIVPSNGVTDRRSRDN